MAIMERKDNMVFKSKVDAWLVGLIVVVFAACVAFPWLAGRDMKLVCVQLSILLPLLLVILYILWGIRYVVGGNRLKVKVGFVRVAEIDVDKIRRIERSYSLISAPAASLDRIGICCDNGDKIIVSPKNKEVFCETIKKINPAIELAL